MSGATMAEDAAVGATVTTAVRSGTLVRAKARKRCPHCGRMVEVGERAVLTDDRHMAHQPNWMGRTYQRGAWHLWHPACVDGEALEHAEREAALAARTCAHCGRGGAVVELNGVNVCRAEECIRAHLNGGG